MQSIRCIRVLPWRVALTPNRICCAQRCYATHCPGSIIKPSASPPSPSLLLFLLSLPSPFPFPPTFLRPPRTRIKHPLDLVPSIPRSARIRPSAHLHLIQPPTPLLQLVPSEAARAIPPSGSSGRWDALPAEETVKVGFVLACVLRPVFSEGPVWTGPRWMGGSVRVVCISAKLCCKLPERTR